MLALRPTNQHTFVRTSLTVPHDGKLPRPTNLKTNMTANPISYNSDGTCSWVHQPGDLYVVTGTTRDGRRFRQVHATWGMARGINLWNGTKWLFRDGRRFRISRTIN